MDNPKPYELTNGTITHGPNPMNSCVKCRRISRLFSITVAAQMHKDAAAQFQVLTYMGLWSLVMLCNALCVQMFLPIVVQGLHGPP